MKKQWQISSADQGQVHQLARELELDELLARLLVLRGVGEAEAARLFLRGTVADGHAPLVMQDMAQAVRRLEQALEQQETIAVYGDYDVDGVTAAALLTKLLRLLGGRVRTYIPDRQQEGYGLHREALQALRKEGCSLVVTVDCGISAVSEAAAPDIPELIITDHHEPGAQLPAAVAVLNPKRSDCGYPDKGLAGVGVALKLAQALWQHRRGDEALPGIFFELAAVGSIADMVPLRGETRLFVREGLRLLRQSSCPGLRALCRVCRLEPGKKITAGQIGFSLGPRLNAAGRMQLAQTSLQLLLSEDAEEAAQLAQQLDEANRLRQETEHAIVAQAVTQCEAAGLHQEGVLVVAGAGWHPGVIGIVASRLVERYYRPVVVLSLQEDGLAKGSCRSIPGFDMFAALGQCGHLLERYGGHVQAAGLTLRTERLAAFRAAMNVRAAAVLQAEDYVPKVQVDAVLPLAAVDESLLVQLELLEPYGLGNPRPRLLLQGVALVGEARQLGRSQEHLKLLVTQGNSQRQVLAWRQGEKACCLPQGSLLDIIGTPEGNEWQGELQVQLTADDLAPSTQAENTRLILDYVAPDIAGLRQVYGWLRSQFAPGHWGCLPLERLRRELLTHCQLCVGSPGLEAALEMFAEAELVQYQKEGGRFCLLPPPARRVDLTRTDAYQRAQQLRKDTEAQWLQRIEIKGAADAWI